MSLRHLGSVWIGGLAAMGLLASGYSPAHSAESAGAGKAVETHSVTASGDQQKHVAEVANRIFAITDLVLDQHIEPATRQEMILAGLRSAVRSRNVAAPNLGRRVSDLKTKEDLTALLNELWPTMTRPTGAASNQFEKALFEGLLRPVPGHAYLLPAKEARVQAQLQANRYIGIGIALGMDDKSHLPQIKVTQAGGPARLGGVRAGDLIEEINHVRVAPETSIGDVVDHLRGPEGSELTIRVRQPDAKESRTLALVRLPVMFKSVKCSAENADEDRIVLLNTKPAIAYLRIDSIMASTARELATWEPRLREAGAKGLVIDLRGTGGRGGFDSYHSALLLADSLLDGKPLGSLLTRDGARKFTADRECLFRDMPLAVLVDGNTHGPAEWVAAALQDAEPRKQKRRRAVIVGDRFLGESDNYVRSAFPLPGSDESLILATGAWERPTVPQQAEPTEESASVDPRYDWHLVPDVISSDEGIAAEDIPAMVVQLARSAWPVAKTTAGKSGERPADQQKKAGAKQAKAATDVSPADVDHRYKQAAIAAIRQQLELSGK
jgi:C-terminal processing protease CtpA/Prc